MAQPQKIKRNDPEDVAEEIFTGTEENPDSQASMRDNGWNFLWHLQRLELTADAKSRRGYQHMLRLGLQFFSQWQGITRPPKDKP